MYLKHRTYSLIGLIALTIALYLLRVFFSNSVRLKRSNSVLLKGSDSVPMYCEGFPTWPLPPEDVIYDTSVGAPKCFHGKSTPFILHQTTAPHRRPSNLQVETRALSKLPSETGYIWHSDEDICDFMRTQPLRFQALFNVLPRTPHKTDLWRYLLLYQQGGIYLDDDAELLVSFNSTFLNSIDSLYMTHGNGEKAMGVSDAVQRPFGTTIYNGFLVSKPCNPVLLSVAERMIQIGPVSKRSPWEKNATHPHLLNWYNLKLLAMAIAERAPEDLSPDPCCTEGPNKCLLFQKSKQNSKFCGRPLAIYKDDNDWTTAVFDLPLSVRPAQQIPD